MADLKIVFVDVYSGAMPSLGLGYLAAVLRRDCGLKNVEIFQKRFVDNLVEKIIAAKPDIVGYISFTPFMNSVIKTTREVAMELDIPQIIGGPHISGIPEALPAEMDIGVIGEGEKTICELVEVFKQHGRFPVNELYQIKNLIFRDKVKLIKTEKREVVTDLDSLPLPARDLLNIKGYFPSTLGVFPFKDLNASGILTSRGCPFHCTFCQPSALFRYRVCSADRVLIEIEELIHKYNVNFVQILEDQFLSNKERFKVIANQVIERGLNKKAAFSISARAEQLDDETCQLLRKMNVKIVGLGLESGSDPILKYLKNPICSVENNQRALDLCRKYNLHAYAGFIFGSPSETIDDMKKTYEFIKRNFMPAIEVQTLIPLPGTKIWDYAKEKGLVSLDMNWNNLLLRVRQDKNQPWLCENVTRQDFFEFFNQFVQPLTWHYNQTMVDFSLKDLLNLQAIRKIWSRPKKYLSAFKHTWIHFWRSKILKGKGEFPN